ncbi:MAG TPA: phosphopantetheine-binding protein [Nocardioides sp.]|uniref:phosphopantetheine-binding protein n=1 Tax=Nocardioides sp. TaxID=35761 RepID=UPI002CF41182|nr:phosphopantetheine-binding protein [Nocardioides sp.]HTW13869.1 phosphopantetheine-binding protein [Nocardioides sp.]
MNAPPSTSEDRQLTVDALRRAVPGLVPEDLDDLADADPLRERLELDSLDFLAFAETLAATARVRIDETDYPDLATLGSCVAFLHRRRASTP